MLPRASENARRFLLGRERTPGGDGLAAYREARDKASQSQVLQLARVLPTRALPFPRTWLRRGCVVLGKMHAAPCRFGPGTKPRSFESRGREGSCSTPLARISRVLPGALSHQIGRAKGGRRALAPGKFSCRLCRMTRARAMPDRRRRGQGSSRGREEEGGGACAYVRERDTTIRPENSRACLASGRRQR